MSSFVERLGLRSKNSKRISDIRPAITPDSLPETFVLPTQNFKLPQALFASIPVANQPETMDVEVGQSKKPELSTERVEVGQSKKPELSTERVEVGQSKKKELANKWIEHPEHILPSLSTNEPKVSHRPETVDVETRSKKRVPSRVTDLHQKYMGVLKPPSHQVGTLFKGERKEQASQSPIVHMRTEMKEIDDDLTESARSLAIDKSEIAKPRPTQIPETTFTVRQQTLREPRHSSVTVTIGRIEVRAIMPKSPPPNESRPILSLGEYLKRRREGTL